MRAAGRERARAAVPAVLLACLASLPACGRKRHEVTFNEHIAPIVHRSCSVCHRPGEAGPFSLLSYADVRKRARQIVRVTARRYMPPWLPEPGYGEFVGSRRLSEEEIASFRKWAEEGAPEGDPARKPAAPSFPPGVWTLGPPDLVIEMSEPYTLRAEGPDDFRNFVLPVPVTGRRHVRAIDIRPGDKRIVHHANVLVDRTGASRRRDSEDPGPGFSGMDLLIESDRFEPHSHFLFWKPGTPPQVEKPGFAWDVEPGTDLVLNMHLFPSGKSERVQAAVGLYFTDEPPTEHPMLIQLENDRALDIPAGDDDFVVTDGLVLPLDVDVLGVYPHAHYLGRDLRGFATLPDGERRELVWIKDWDLNWQGVFRYRDPIFLPRGSKLEMRYRYDNSALNLRNPNNPPIRVRAGNRSADEMAHLWIQVRPHGGEDSGLLLQEALMRHRLERDPAEFSSHFNLAAALQSLGRRTEAIAHYRRALEIEPASATARNALGTAYVEQHRLDLAQHEFQQVLDREPDQIQARYNLARVFLARAELARAEREIARILAREPDDLDSLYTLGYILASQGRLQQAIVPYERALRLAPEDADTHNTLGQILAMLGQLPAAQRHFESALRLDPASADARDGLARVRSRLAKHP